MNGLHRIILHLGWLVVPILIIPVVTSKMMNIALGTGNVGLSNREWHDIKEPVESFLLGIYLTAFSQWWWATKRASVDSSQKQMRFDQVQAGHSDRGRLSRDAPADANQNLILSEVLEGLQNVQSRLMNDSQNSQPESPTIKSFEDHNSGLANADPGTRSNVGNTHQRDSANAGLPEQAISEKSGFSSGNAQPPSKENHEEDSIQQDDMRNASQGESKVLSANAPKEHASEKSGFPIQAPKAESLQESPSSLVTTVPQGSAHGELKISTEEAQYPVCQDRRSNRQPQEALVEQNLASALSPIADNSLRHDQQSTHRNMASGSKSSIRKPPTKRSEAPTFSLMGQKSEGQDQLSDIIAGAREPKSSDRKLGKSNAIRPESTPYLSNPPAKPSPTDSGSGRGNTTTAAHTQTPLISNQPHLPMDVISSEPSGSTESALPPAGVPASLQRQERNEANDKDDDDKVTNTTSMSTPEPGVPFVLPERDGVAPSAWKGESEVDGNGECKGKETGEGEGIGSTGSENARVKSEERREETADPEGSDHFAIANSVVDPTLTNLHTEEATKKYTAKSALTEEFGEKNLAGFKEMECHEIPQGHDLDLE
ncbi:uncharacterized protein KY384_002885 [Bacidia gigantensis]|uniref:uncharacterized protein n=1 Tax=Bacidia gigantensis TaxID=2732470 RepID=UPI001D0579E3|nr:uncharacterized protein KY384_002885 [Bacidia gigantensis]KAG8532400.1 hypothetical protein KY384_002885 [Bacidia gigantensis]